MSQDLPVSNDGRRIVTPQTIDDDADDNVNGSPVERARDAFGDSIRPDFTIDDPALDDHPLVITAGSRDVIESSASAKLMKLLSDDLYAETDPFFREWKQNHIAAVVREAKRRLRNEVGEDAIYHYIEHDHEALDDPVTLRLPMTGYEIIELAREKTGYLPTIEYRLDHDEHKLITRDNGIGMTTGTAIDVWNEPVESGSGTDLSSAGNKGIGALTWATIAGDHGVIKVATRTLRQQTASGSPVPQRDRDGYQFLGYLGFLIPIPDSVEDGFFGTRFEIPIDANLDTHTFKRQLNNYTDVLPAPITWYETESGVTEDDEWDATSFWDRYSEEPSITIDRPGEFRVALDRPSVVSKGHDDNTTFLLDNPIDRNAEYGWSVETLWNEHIQILNEQGLIVAGPNRGRKRANVDELYGDVGDIDDPGRPMPDVPLPEPTTSRDQLKQDESLERFLKYVNHVAQEREKEVAADYLDGAMACDTPAELLDYVLDRGTEYDLYWKLTKQHGSYRTPKDSYKLYGYLVRENIIDNHDATKTIDDFDDDEKPRDINLIDGRYIKSHPKWDVVEALTDLAEHFSVADADSRGDPNKKNNRRESKLGSFITAGNWPIYIGATLNRDRVTVLHDPENEPEAGLIKTQSYHKWQRDGTIHKAIVDEGGYVKNIPFTHDEEAETAKDWTIPQRIHDEHTRTNTTTDDTDDADDGGIENYEIGIRHTENSAIDTRTSFESVLETLDETKMGHPLKWTNSGENHKPYLVVFPPSGENISDHYELSGVTNIINARAKHAERLLEHTQVFTVADFHRFLDDTRLTYRDPFSGTGGTAKITTLTNDKNTDQALVVVDSTENPVAWDLYANTTQSDKLNGLDAASLDVVRERGFNQMKNRRFFSPVKYRNGETLPDDKITYRLVDWADVDEFTRTRAKTFWSLNLSSTGFDEWSPVYIHGHAMDSRPSHYTHISDGNYHRIIERAQYPAWDHRSDAWSRVGSYRQTEYEKHLMFLARDYGIDPTAGYFAGNPEQVRVALDHLIQGCYDQ